MFAGVQQVATRLRGIATIGNFRARGPGTRAYSARLGQQFQRDLGTRSGALGRRRIEATIRWSGCG
jgi:hypothetical protein